MAGGLAEVDDGGRQHAGVALRVVVPGEEALAEGAGVLGCSRSDGGNSGRYFLVWNWLSE